MMLISLSFLISSMLTICLFKFAVPAAFRIFPIPARMLPVVYIFLAMFLFGSGFGAAMLGLSNFKDNMESPGPVPSQISGEVKLKQLRGYGDFVGRNEALEGNGSPDSHLALDIQAPSRTIKGLMLRERKSGQPIWDTIFGNHTWLVAVTKKNKLISRANGELMYYLNGSKETLDLWVQDNHTLAARKKQIELVIHFNINPPLILALKR
ncbi:MAG: hypothetical protein GY737_27825 [Desulfobacteraceae bacterium]|nr:hypothetical protein [Desulfobacteraceae bacterium]